MLFTCVACWWRRPSWYWCRLRPHVAQARWKKDEVFPSGEKNNFHSKVCTYLARNFPWHISFVVYHLDYALLFFFCIITKIHTLKPAVNWAAGSLFHPKCIITFCLVEPFCCVLSTEPQPRGRFIKFFWTVGHHWGHFIMFYLQQVTLLEPTTVPFPNSSKVRGQVCFSTIFTYSPLCSSLIPP